VVKYPNQLNPTANQLYVGDFGTLPLDVRLALCKLLTGPFIDSESMHWPVVLREENLLRTRLADVFLDLLIDRERRVAFIRQADTGDIETPVLMRSTKLSFLDSVLLLHLREALIDAETRNERAVIDEAELYEHLDLFTGADGDRVLGQKRIRASIKNMRESSILKSIGGNESRFEISPVLRLLFTANDVEALGRLYRKRAAGEPVTVDDLKLTGTAMPANANEEATDE
jgi:hypothetical protein